MRVKAKKSIIEYIGRDWIIEAGSKLRLSTREIELVLMLLEGVDDATELAERMRVTPGTVQAYLANIFRKTGYNTRLSVAMMVLGEAIELKFVQNRQK